MNNRLEGLSQVSLAPDHRISGFPPSNGQVVAGELIAKESAEKPAKPPVRILVADDDKSILDLFKMFLVDDLSKDYLTNDCFFRDGEQLVNGATAMIEKCETDTRPFIIVSDQRMPGLLGNEAIKQIRKKAEEKNIAVYAIGVSAFHEINMLKGFDAKVSKPFDLDDLVAKIKQGFETLNVPWPNSSTEVADIADV